MSRASAFAIAICIATAANYVAGCSCDKSGERSSGPGAAPSVASALASASAAPVGIPIDPEEVQKAVNPNREKPYSGPVGSVRGTVTVSGDQALELKEVLSKYTPKCPESAKERYGKLFREGRKRGLGDALVAVTEYQGFVPVRDEVVRIEIQDCWWGTRTVAMTFGQRIEIWNKDKQAHVPHLLRGRMKALMVALPGGDSIKLYPTKPRRYGLTDQMLPVMFADVFVLKYSTHAVTDLNGEYEIGGIPVGEVAVNALMPSTMLTAKRKVTIRKDQTTEANFTIHFDAEKHAPKPPKPAASGVPPIH